MPVKDLRLQVPVVIMGLSQEMLKTTWDKNADEVAEIADGIHDRADHKTYNDEAALS